ncbi:MAG TPA: HAD family hydrolase [Anaeromyxobacter sp.]|nr:HAD family hydrolase [Anaeromyxobacter sp.]
MKPYRLVLLDVDGTLVSCGGAGRRALERVLREACQEPDGDLSALRLDGSTDRLIVRHAMEILEYPFTEEACDRALERYVGLLEAELSDTSFLVLPGAPELLESLRRRGQPYGLCTGNVREGARLKLRRGALDGYFEWGPQAVGGFASDGEVRARLVEAAVRRAITRHGPLAPGEAVVVGDTPLDIEAAHAAGCAALAVATGRYGADELRSCGAEHVVESLAVPLARRLLSGP